MENKILQGGFLLIAGILVGIASNKIYNNIIAKKRLDKILKDEKID